MTYEKRREEEEESRGEVRRGGEVQPILQQQSFAVEARKNGNPGHKFESECFVLTGSGVVGTVLITSW